MNQKGNVWLIGLLLVGLFVGLPVLGVAFKLITLPWLQFTTKIDQNQQIIKKTYDADNQIYNYHWFQETAGAIDALANQIVNAEKSRDNFMDLAGIRSNWTFEDKTEAARLNSVVLGLRNQRESLIREYNAKANEADRGIFQNGLKTFIPLD